MGLLIHRLLTLLNTEEPNSTNYHIAMTFLQNYDSISTLSIGSMATLCSVSKSTLSKFARSIGFEDYFDLKDKAPFKENRFQFNLNYVSNILTPIENEGTDPYFEAIIKDIQFYQKSINLETIDRLANDLIKYENVAAFGLLFSESAAIDFQYKLAYNQKFIFTCLSDIEQEKFIGNAKEDTLVIIFSNSGDYVKKNQLKEGNFQKKIFQKTKAKIVLVTSNSKMVKSKDIDYCILFHHETSSQTHYFMYQIVTDMIVHRYRYFKQSII